jgi:hypothetical protein
MGYKRVLYVAKLNEAEMKGELESNLNLKYNLSYSTFYFRGINKLFQRH